MNSLTPGIQLSDHFVVRSRFPEEQSPFGVQIRSETNDIPLPMDSNMSQTANSIPAAYPATTKQVVGLVDGVPTDVTSVLFADKIMVTVSQGGRLAQWARFTPLPNNPTSDISPDTRPTWFFQPKFRRSTSF